STAEDEVRRLAEELAILRAGLERLERAESARAAATDPDPDPAPDAGVPPRSAPLTSRCRTLPDMSDRVPTATRGLVGGMVCTAAAGLCGYLIQILAPALLTDPEVYLAFSVFWSTLYLFGTGLGGVQQEVARASRATDDRGPTRVLTRFT